MKQTYKSLMAGVLALGLAGAGLGMPASAAPATGLKPLTHVTTGTNSDVVQVQHRRHFRGHGRHFRGHRHYGHRHYRHRRGWGTGAAIVGGVVAGALIADAARGRSYSGGSYSDVERCEATYRSFDRRTGTYTTYGGETRLCPYLR